MKHVPIQVPGKHGVVKTDEAALKTLKQMIERKQRVEWEMAKRLLAECDDVHGLLHNGLKGMVFNAMDDIEDIWRAKGDQAIRMAYYKDVGNYGFAKELAAKETITAETFYAKLSDRSFIETLNAKGLGNLIRFYGEVIEAGKHLTNEPAPGWLKKPKWEDDAGAAVNIPKQTWKDPKLGSFFAGHETHMRTYQKFKEMGFWDKKDTPDKTGQRKREKLADKLKREATELLNERSQEFTGSKAERHKQALKEAEKAFLAKKTKVERELHEASGGISIWHQLNDDLVNKIDLVFGLSHGATISGTTADTMYFVNRMSLLDKYLAASEPDAPIPDYLQAYFEGWDYQIYKETHQKVILKRNRDGSVQRILYNRPPKRYSGHGFQGLDPVYYMLPIGLIAGAAHHTTTEIALPLALNLNEYHDAGNRVGEVLFDYSIGLYRGLMPKRGKAREGAPGAGVEAIDKILGDAEDNPNNELFLIYYDSSQKPAGYITFDKHVGDKVIWNQIAKTGVKLMDTFKAFKPYPSRENIASLHPAIKSLVSATAEKPKVTTGGEGHFQERRSAFEPRGN